MPASISTSARGVAPSWGQSKAIAVSFVPTAVFRAHRCKTIRVVAAAHRAHHPPRPLGWGQEHSHGQRIHRPPFDPGRGACGRQAFLRWHAGCFGRSRERRVARHPPVGTPDHAAAAAIRGPVGGSGISESCCPGSGGSRKSTASAASAQPSWQSRRFSTSARTRSRPSSIWRIRATTSSRSGLPRRRPHARAAGGAGLTRGSCNFRTDRFILARVATKDDRTPWKP